jgi:hypothetical protein
MERREILSQNSPWRWVLVGHDVLGTQLHADRDENAIPSGKFSSFHC